MMRKDERFSKTCDCFRLFKKQSNDCSVGKKVSLKYSTVYSYIKNSKEEMKIVISGLNWIPWNRTNSFIVQKTIKGYIKSMKEEFTAKDIKNFVQKEHKILISTSMIIKLMKH